MQATHEASEASRTRPQTTALTVPGRRGTIPVTVRLDPPRYDRLKRLVARLSTTGQSIIQGALDRSLTSLERVRTEQPMVTGQSSLFAAPETAASSRSARPRQDSFAFVRPEPTVGLTYRASVPMHRWLKRRSYETGQSIQDIIDDALRQARGEG